MNSKRKITVKLPSELLQQALKAGGEGLAGTLRKGLQLVMRRSAYHDALKLKGTLDLGIGDLDEFRRDRRVRRR